MTLTVKDVMTRDPICCEVATTAAEAARMMRNEDIGDVLVRDGDRLRGIVTDRDLVVRLLATGGSPATTLGDVCSDDVACIEQDATITDAAQLMRQLAVRRLPVVQDGRPIGIVSIGDLEIQVHPGSLLAGISSAPPNS